MDELDFTWRFALKLFAALLLLGVWLMARSQAKLDEQDRRSRAAARENGTPLPARRVVSRSNRLLVAVAIVFLVIALLWGNESTL